MLGAMSAPHVDDRVRPSPALPLTLAVALFAAFGALLDAGCQPAGRPPFSEDEQDEKVVDPFVTAHNAVRAAVSPAASPPLAPLRWSDPLASVARAWAERCNFEHSTNAFGENLAFFSGERSTPEDVVASWAGEDRFYDYARNSCQESQQCGHYTQIVWRDTEELGCGAALCTIFGAEGIFWVCNYDPPGNFIGERPY
jgi:pathogenesis-related protein 1